MMVRKKKEVALTSAGLPADYPKFLESLKCRVQQAQTKAMLSVNRELIQLYWDIGRLIVERQEQAGWGKGIVDRLASDIQKAFPGMGGFSPANVWRMRAFFLAYRPSDAILARAVRELASDQSPSGPNRKKLAQPVRELPTPILPQPVAEIPWGHNVTLMEKVKVQAQRLWYAAKTLEHGWSRAILSVQIETDLYARHGKAISNFAATLPEPQSDLVQQALKDPYLFDFLTLHDDAVERDRGDRSGVRAGGIIMTEHFPSFLEDDISQIPALQLLQNLGWEYLTPAETVALHGGKRSSVVLDGVLVPQLRKLNKIRFKGTSTQPGASYE